MSDYEEDDNSVENEVDWNMDENTDEEPEPSTTGATDEGEPIEDNPQQVIDSCLQMFGGVDYIMEPGVASQLARFFQCAGDPTDCVKLLSENYKGLAQMVNLLAEFLITAGVDVNDVQAIVEDHLKEMIVKHFDAVKADSIFANEGETPSWLNAMIEYKNWRDLFYRLSTLYPDCLMLNFTIKLICDLGHQSEITAVSTACHQLEVFTSVLGSKITRYLTGEGTKPLNPAATSKLCTKVDYLNQFIDEFTNMACYGEHTYLYVQHLLTSLITAGNPNFVMTAGSTGASNLKYLSQCVEKEALNRNFDITSISLMLAGASRYPRAYVSLSSMLTRKSLNPADVTVLFKLYNQPDPPHIDLIRTPQFLELLVQSLFKPGVKINADHIGKYVYLLAYASCVYEQYNKKGQIKNINKDELRTTIQAIERANSLCSENKGSHELIADVGTLFQCIKFPPAALGILTWIDFTVSASNYFTLNTDHTPIHLLLLDEIVSNHQLLHERVFKLLVRLFNSDFDSLDVLIQITLKKSLLDRMIHLMSKGFVLQVISYIQKCIVAQHTDTSLIRYFATEVLDVVCPPYSEEFVQLFFPLIDNKDIISRGDNLVEEFLGYCKSTYNI